MIFILFQDSTWFNFFVVEGDDMKARLIFTENVSSPGAIILERTLS